MPTLVVKAGPLAGERIELTGELIVGREHADLTIDDPEVSRRHAAIRPRDGAVEVEDLGSTNGTLVDGVRIEGPVTLGGGARLQFGETAIEIELDAVDDGSTRLHERPPAPDLTMMRPTPPPDATAAYSAPPAAAPESAPSAAPPAEPAVAHAAPAEASSPTPAPAAAAPPAPAPRAQPASAEQPFGAFAPSPAGRGRRRRGVATRLWIPTVLTFATVGGTAAALVLYFAGR